MIHLYDLPASGNCYRVRLMLALLSLPYERIVISFSAGRLDLAGLARMNPLEEVPILRDGDVLLRDSQAILVYLARQYRYEWMPYEPAKAGAVCQWLSFAANEIQHGPRYARAISLGMVEGDLQRFQRLTLRAFAGMNAHLEGRQWLETGRPTVADVACYPYICNAGEGGIDMEVFPNIRRWLGNVEGLPGFIPFDPAAPQQG